MTTPTIFQWYRILRQQYRFTVFRALRGALAGELAGPGSEQLAPDNGEIGNLK